jgi:hypothetical protein
MMGLLEGQSAPWYACRPSSPILGPPLSPRQIFQKKMELRPKMAAAVYPEIGAMKVR